nr:PD-(D/E)XK nuclease family protein [Clostridiales bacterium]
YLADYLEENGVELKNDKKFEYEYNNLISTMTDVFARMIAEFKVSSFEPIGQEYDIKKEMLCDDGSKMTMNGSIDRVDKYIADDGNEYIRVVDYKTYVKNFRLDYVLVGLNMQMLIYLFTITGKGYMDSATPAGVLYYKTKKASTSFDSRDLTESEKFEKKVADNRGSGMYLLNDDVQNAMEKDKAELFYPLTDSKGNLIENLVTLEEIGKISELVDRNLNNMVSNLHNGEIEIKPIYNSTEKLDGCEYCDYANVCGFETVLYEQNKFSKHTKAEVLATLEKDGESDA